MMQQSHIFLSKGVMVFNATFNNISEISWFFLFVSKLESLKQRWSIIPLNINKTNNYLSLQTNEHKKGHNIRNIDPAL